jgi:hypothetical protein
MSDNLVDYAQKNSFESKPKGYLEIYQRHFATLKDRPIKLLELGVAKGASMQMWRDFFPKAVIAGLDLLPEWESDDPRVRIYRGAQNDTALLTKIADECAPDGFDIIVDDAAHIGEMAKISFWHLFLNHLKPGGIYAIEDWGTGYFGGYRNVYYPDGEFFDPTEPETFTHRLANKILKTAPVEWQETKWWQKLLKRYQYTRRFKVHNYGLVGFVTQLIGEVGMGDITSPAGVAKPKDPPEPRKKSRFAHVLYAPGVVLVTKRN